MLLARKLDRFLWIAQSRGVDFVDEKRVVNMPVDVNLAAELVVKFCPFCGTRLSDLVDVNPEEANSLAEQHQTLIGMP